MKRSSRRLPRC